MPTPAPQSRRSGVTGQEQPIDARGQFTPTSSERWRALTVNLRESEVELVIAAAEAAGLSRSGWMREIIRAALPHKG